MKFVIVLIAMILCVGCSVGSSMKISQITGNKYVGRDLAEALASIKEKGLYCNRSSREEKDERLKVLTDGTLDEVEFYHCVAEVDQVLGVARNVTFMVAQYGKVLRIHGNVSVSSYLWN